MRIFGWLRRNNVRVGTTSYATYAQDSSQTEKDNHVASAIHRFHNYQRARHEQEDRKTAADYWWVRGTAFFAFVAAIATAFAAVFTGVSMNAANQSAKQARRQADEAQKQTVQSTRQADAVSRPYVFVTFGNANSFHRWMGGGPTPDLEFTATNFGQSPAIIESIKCFAEWDPIDGYRTNIANYAISGVEDMAYNRVSSVMSVSGKIIRGGSGYISGSCINPWPVNPWIILPGDKVMSSLKLSDFIIALNEHYLWFIAEVIYSDVSHKQHFTRICAKYELAGAARSDDNAAFSYRVAGPFCDQHS